MICVMMVNLKNASMNLLCKRKEPGCEYFPGLVAWTVQENVRTPVAGLTGCYFQLPGASFMSPLFFRFSHLNINAVMPPDITIVSRSTGARTIPGMPLKRNPSPKRYRCPCNRIISPTYISSVITEATIDGIQTETNLFLSKRNEPAKTPADTPRRTKNKVIKTADKGDTWILPSLQKAVKQARIQSPRNAKEQTDCKIKDLRRFLLPVLINWPKP